MIPRPRSSVTVFDLGYRPSSTGRFLDQVDSKLSLLSRIVNHFNSFWCLKSLKIVGINTGGLVRTSWRTMGAERDQKQNLLASLRLDHEAAKLKLKGLEEEEEELNKTLDKLQQNLTGHIRIMENAYSHGYISVAIGYQLTIKTLRVQLAVRSRDLSQKSMALLDEIEATKKELSDIELNIRRTEVRLRVINSQLRPVQNLGDALNAA